MSTFGSKMIGYCKDCGKGIDNYEDYVEIDDNIFQCPECYEKETGKDFYDMSDVEGIKKITIEEMFEMMKQKIRGEI